MLYLSGNLKKYRMKKGLTQEDVAGFLGVTPQSVSKWERGECYPDITFLPALASIFETSMDLLFEMDTVRTEESRYSIHKKASELQCEGDYAAAEAVYRDALRSDPNDAGMMLGLAGVLALSGKTEESTVLTERGLALSKNEKQKATMRAALCFLYLKDGKVEEAAALASRLPHVRECREEIKPFMRDGVDGAVIDAKLRMILLGE